MDGQNAVLNMHILGALYVTIQPNMPDLYKIKQNEGCGLNNDGHDIL